MENANLMLETQENTFSMTELPDPTNLPGHSPREQLCLILKKIKNWEELSESQQDVALTFFMICVGHLYMDYFQHHLDEAKECAKEHEETLKGLMEPLDKWYILPCLDQLDRMSEDSDLVWAEACELCTNLEAFKDMFSETSGFFSAQQMEYIRDYMNGYKVNSMFLSDEEIPKNAPESHWWWFYKEEYTRERWAARDNFLQDEEE